MTGSNTGKIRWGIAGPGNIARKFAVAAKNTDCAELVAVASRSSDRAHSFAEKYDIDNFFGSYEEMAKSDLVDAVYIATPHPFHKECAEFFLDSGKHVLCEKPMCINAFQEKSLCETAKRNKVFLMEAMWTRFLPAINMAKEIAHSGKIGDVMGIEADFCYRLTPEEEPKIFTPDMAGGSLLDVGIYLLHFTAHFFGTEPESITAVSNINYGVDCHTNIILKYKDGQMANLTSATTLHKPENAYIYGTKGHIYVPDFYTASKIYVCTAKGEKLVEAPFKGNGFEEEIIECCNCINAGKTQSDVLPHSESVAIAEQMDEIRRQIGVRYPFDGEDF